MLLKNPYPICEFDTSREALIRPEGFLEELSPLPPRCVITFFRRELQQLVEERQLPVIGQLHSEVLDIPIYQYRRKDGEDICITMAFLTAPGAACTIEELHAMGCRGFVICGAAGALQGGSSLGEIILPTAAVRDEGTSYHYLPPSREVACHPGAVEHLAIEPTPPAKPGPPTPSTGKLPIWWRPDGRRAALRWRWRQPPSSPSPNTTASPWRSCFTLGTT